MTVHRKPPCHYCGKPADGIYGYVPADMYFEEYQMEPPVNLVHAHRECATKGRENAEKEHANMEGSNEEGFDEGFVEEVADLFGELLQGAFRK